MKRLKLILQVVIWMALLAVLAFGLSGLLSSLNDEPGTSGSSPSSVQPSASLPDTSPADAAYPPPGVTEPPDLQEGGEPTPTAVHIDPFPEAPPPPAGAAATLHNGDAWLVASGREPEQLTHVGDVTVIFGWNYDGTLLLFGRGRTEQPQYVGDTTDLWLMEVQNRDTRPLSPGEEVKNALWAPDDNRLAVCGLGDRLSVIEITGQVLGQLDQVICDYSWSPDGSAIAVGTYTQDMIAPDGLKFNVLSIWRPVENTRQDLSDAVGEVQARPLWSVDGRRILFQRFFHLDENMQALSGIYIVEIENGQMSRLESPSTVIQEASRSPRGDTVAFQDGGNVYLIDFDGNLQRVGEGREVIWIADGQSLLFRSEDGQWQVAAASSAVTAGITGGGSPPFSFYHQPKYIFIPGG